MNDSVKHTLSGQVAVIAGGTGGIGYAAARRLAECGAKVVLLTRSDTEKAAAMAAELPGSGHGALFAAIDDSATLRAAADAVQVRWGRADILVNSAGMTKPVPHKDLDALDDALIDQLFIANWRGPFATIRAFAPLLRASGNGLVVNVSSIAATTGIGSNVAYCAAKAGLDVMATSLGRALAPDIRVISVSPGVVDTTFVPGRDATFNEKQAATTPLKRIGSPDDIAAAIEACATTLKFVTGTTIQVDGGRHLGAA
ncbi:SDR family NAD(P)-dependent oxidoreductase [Noviherbaspirillum denitrificans]|uniref:Short-chain dehydrogenase n=1 Tax=Noviherbaspirillum denitrificans TaxID=1968433 RepID=A0A254TEW9_9BURK|nr:SDR family oxidoreductase [Noviherbaspirillum denitrificans]OWW21181.1 short-chain dehydrogenase [Noviherbaspirillum denitrificans]